jgi:hypothetical protein
VPIDGGFKTHAAPGDFFPLIQQSFSGLTDINSGFIRGGRSLFTCV